jgi:hypothetical protein
MDVSQIEAAVKAARDPSNPATLEATMFLGSLKTNPPADAWKAGLELLNNSSDNVAKLFGLQLIRSTLSFDNPTSNDLNSVGYIRSGMWEILRGVLSDESSTCPPYILNALVSVVILCTKIEYPHQWPTAFTDIIGLSTFGWNGIQMAVKMFVEFDTEFIDTAYSDSRSGTDSTHIRRVKDEMRSSGIVTEIINFLCEVAPQARSNDNVDLCNNSLSALSRFVSWVDIEMFVEKALPTVYEALKDEGIRGSAFLCLLEIVKKGMTHENHHPFEKLQLLANIKFFETIAQIPITLEEDDETGLGELGQLLNETLLVLIDMWKICQSEIKTIFVDSGQNNGDIINYYAAISEYMNVLLQSLIIPLFSHPDTDIFSSMVESLQKLVSLVGNQTDNANAGWVNQVRSSYPQFFIAAEYVDPLLSVIFKVIQYPENYDGIDEDDDDEEVRDAVDEVEKLFKNIVKVAPTSALNGVSSFLQSLPQPLSQAPVQSIEAALRMLCVFGEMPRKSFPAIETTFASIVKAIHSTDIANHTNPMVLLQYFELTYKFFKFIDDTSIFDVIHILLGPQGLRNGHAQLRNRCAYLFYKIVTDSLSEKTATLLPVISSFSDLILTDGRQGHLSTKAEEYLLEAISFVIFSDADESEATRALQNQLLQDLSSILVTQLNELIVSPILANPTDGGYVELLNVISHKISSLNSVATSFRYEKRPDTGVVFTYCGNTILSACRDVGLKSLEVKKAAGEDHPGYDVYENAFMYFKKMLKAHNVESLEAIRDIMALVLQTSSEAEHISSCIQLLDISMLEFESNAFPLVQLHCQSLIQKNEQTFALILQEAGILDASFAEVPGVDSSIIAGIEIQSQRLQTQVLKLIVDAADKNCFGVFNVTEDGLDLALSTVKNGIVGGRYLVGGELKLVLRRQAVNSLSSLCELTQRYFLQNSENEAVAATSFPGIDISFLQRAITWAINEGLDFLFQACIDKQSISLREPKTVVFVGDFGKLLYRLFVIDSKSTSDKLISLFQGQGWPSDKANELYALLQQNTTEDRFSEAFKGIITNL